MWPSSTNMRNLEISPPSLNSNVLSDPHRLLKAISYAAEQHVRQRRKGVPSGTHKRTPYINHPIRVATLLARARIEDIDILSAAILHDTVEDTDTTPDDLRRKFGGTITSIVLEVTDDKSLPKAERRLLQIQHAPQLSDAAALVKLADKVDNIRDLIEEPPDWTTTRVKEYFQQARQVVDGLRNPHPNLLQWFDAYYARRPTSDK